MIGKIFRFVVRISKAYLMLVGLMVTLVLCAVAFIPSWTSNHSAAPAPTLAHDASLAVTLHLEGQIAQQKPRFEEFVLEQLFDERLPLYLPDLGVQLRRAAIDERVKGLFVEIGQLNGDMAAFAELRRLFVHVRQAGKPVHVYFSSAQTLTYYLASAANRVTISPAGSLTIPGPVLSLVYFGDLLRNIGVDFEVVRSGAYKSAFEPLIANQPSPEALSDFRALESSLRSHTVEAVAEGRTRSVDEVRGWFTDSFFETDDAVDKGIVDATGYRRNAWKEFTTTVGEKTRTMKLGRYATAALDLDDAIRGSKSDGIALIEAVGQIAMSGKESDGVLTPEGLHSKLKWARNAKTARAVVLRIDSPGGSAVASDVIWREVKALAKTKPVVVSMGSVAASGGYYIAAPATRILASPTTITGSIGVIAGIPSFEAFAEKYGINFHVVTQSDRARLIDPGQRAGDDDRRIMEKGVLHVYETFLARVAEGRGLDKGDVRAAAEGKVFTGRQALELGLVDEIGGLAEAFSVAKELAGLDPGLLYPVLRYHEGRFNLSECLFGEMTLFECWRALDSQSSLGATVRAVVAPKTTSPIVARLLRTARLFEEEPVLTLWPTLGTAGRSGASITAIDGL